MPRIAKAHIVPDYRPLVKDVVKLLRSHGAVPMPADVRRRLQKAGMHGMSAFSLVTSRERLVSGNCAQFSPFLLINRWLKSSLDRRSLISDL